MKITLRQLTLSGMLAAYYVLVSYLLQPISYGPMQFRLAEVMTVLPLLFPEAIFGLGIGCFFVNLSSPFGIYDWGFGTLATVLAACLTYRFRRNRFVALSMPVWINGIIVGAYVSSLLSLPFWSTALYISLSQAIIVFGLGTPLLLFLQRTRYTKKQDSSSLH